MGGTIKTLMQVTVGKDALTLEKRDWELPHRRYLVKWKYEHQHFPELICASGYAEEACREFLEAVYQATSRVLEEEAILPRPE